MGKMLRQQGQAQPMKGMAKALPLRVASPRHQLDHYSPRVEMVPGYSLKSVWSKLTTWDAATGDSPRWIDSANYLEALEGYTDPHGFGRGKQYCRSQIRGAARPGQESQCEGTERHPGLLFYKKWSSACSYIMGIQVGTLAGTVES